MSNDYRHRGERLGDWEADTVIGKKSSFALVTLVERKSRFTLVKKINRRTADSTKNAVIHMLKPYRLKALTITFDNGKEFAAHQEIAEELNADVYLAHPYASWERGTNENTNGLLRQYFPTSQRLYTVKEAISQKSQIAIRNLLKTALTSGPGKVLISEHLKWHFSI